MNIDGSVELLSFYRKKKKEKTLYSSSVFLQKKLDPIFTLNDFINLLFFSQILDCVKQDWPRSVL